MSAEAAGWTLRAFTTKMQDTTSEQSGKLFEGYAPSLQAQYPPPVLLAWWEREEAPK